MDGWNELEFLLTYEWSDVTEKLLQLLDLYNISLDEIWVWVRIYGRCGVFAVVV